MSTVLRRGGSIVRRLISVVFGFALGAAALALLGAFLLSMFGIARFVPILSNSMAPDMPVGSLAIAQPIERQSVATGDVVIFSAPIGPDRRVIHRVTNVVAGEQAERIVNWDPNKLYMETKGDNNPAADPWIVTISDDTVWTATNVVPSIGWPAIWLGDARMRFAAFGLAGIAVVAWALIVVWRRPEEDENDAHSLEHVSESGARG
jgi:signal peptidase